MVHAQWRNWHFFAEGRKPNFPDKLYNIMFKIDYPWNYLLPLTTTVLYVLFQKRIRVFDHGIKTRENNKNHEAVDE